MKKYYNATTKEWYNEGQSLTRRVENGVFTGIPSEEQLYEWGFREWVEPAPTPYEPTEEEVKKQRMSQIQEELSSMDYLTSKYIDGEDMSEYGDWQGKRKALREEYRKLKKELSKQDEYGESAS
jgi:hypothetical protein